MIKSVLRMLTHGLLVLLLVLVRVAGALTGSSSTCTLEAAHVKPQKADSCMLHPMTDAYVLCVLSAQWSEAVAVGAQFCPCSGLPSAALLRCAGGKSTCSIQRDGTNSIKIQQLRSWQCSSADFPQRRPCDCIRVRSVSEISLVTDAKWSVWDAALTKATRSNLSARKLFATQSDLVIQYAAAKVVASTQMKTQSGER